MSTAPVFWAVALALVALTLAVLLWPLVRRTRTQAPSEEAARAAVYRDQKRQLDEDLARGVLSGVDHAAAVGELAQRLGVELDDAAVEAPHPARERLGLVAALGVVAIIPAGAIVLYLVLGTPDALRPQAKAQPRPSDREIVAMVESLAAKMKADPSDPRGWRLLARSYAALGRYDDSSAAYAQAVQRGGEDADVLTDWAESMALARNRRVSGEPERLAARALALQPDHAKALALLATAAFERRDFDGSIALWQKLEATLPPGSEDVAQTQAAIAEIERIRTATSAGPKAGPAGSASASATQAPAGSPSTSATQAPPMAAPATQAPAAAAAPPARASASSVAPGATIAGRVELAPAVAARTAPGDTLYVFARAAGGRMPLAVLRVPAGTWPHAFALDDSMSMTGGTKLSAAPSVTIEARVSRSGNATPQPGDVVSASVAAQPGARDVRIVLDRVLP